jgi:hypothetical protein
MTVTIIALALIASAPQKPAQPPKPDREKPPVLALKEMHLYAPETDGSPEVHKLVRVAHPRDWKGEIDRNRRSMRLLGPNGEGELVIAAFLRPDELGPELTRLKNGHPGSAPSPPQAMKVQGIDPLRGERATRFTITGHESGEMVMIERGGAIILFAAIVAPSAWAELKAVLERCYPTVAVSDVGE